MVRVLLAADPGPPRTRGLLRASLESARHDVREVSDGMEALAALDANPPELVILDTALPSLDGFQVLVRRHGRGSAATPPILVISTLPTQLAEQLVYALGAVGYLHKPFSFQELYDAVAGVLEAAPGSRPRGAGPRDGQLPPADDRSELRRRSTDGQSGAGGGQAS